MVSNSGSGRSFFVSDWVRIPNVGFGSPWVRIGFRLGSVLVFDRLGVRHQREHSAWFRLELAMVNLHLVWNSSEWARTRFGLGSDWARR